MLIQVNGFLDILWLYHSYTCYNLEHGHDSQHMGRCRSYSSHCSYIWLFMSGSFIPYGKVDTGNFVDVANGNYSIFTLISSILLQMRTQTKMRRNDLTSLIHQEREEERDSCYVLHMMHHWVVLIGMCVVMLTPALLLFNGCVILWMTMTTSKIIVILVLISATMYCLVLAILLLYQR